MQQEHLQRLSKIERANIWTHAIGVPIFVLLTPFLAYQAAHFDSLWLLIACLCFGAAHINMYLGSTIYHYRWQGKRRLLRRWDHISIYFLIAGSYMPFMMRYFSDDLGPKVIITLLALSIVGTFFKIYTTGKLEKISVLAYLLMGWTAVFIIKPMLATVPSDVMTAIAIGGGFYTVGVIFYINKRLAYHHAIWHLFVLGGSLSMWWAAFLALA